MNIGKEGTVPSFPMFICHLSFSVQPKGLYIESKVFISNDDRQKDIRMSEDPHFKFVATGKQSLKLKFASGTKRNRRRISANQSDRPFFDRCSAGFFNNTSSKCRQWKNGTRSMRACRKPRGSRI